MNRDLTLERADELAHAVYRATRDFPRGEIFGITSQLRRAVLSVPLNLVEGFARQNLKERVKVSAN